MSTIRPAGKLRETPALDRWPELRPFVRDVAAYYGDRLQAVLLYGSRARGEECEESDYDLAVLLPDLTDRFKEVTSLSNIACPYLLDRNMFIQAMPLHPTRIAEPKQRDFFARNIALDGIALLGFKP